MTKYIKDGKVAVLVSPDYGHGWSSPNWGAPELAMIGELVKLIEEEASSEVLEQAAAKYVPAHRSHYINSCDIEWVPIGTRFRIQEYDGAEWIERYEDCTWLVA